LNSNLNSSSISGFSALLYVNFIIKKKYRVDAIAKEMQVATDTLYRYVRGENIMPPDRIVDLIRATKDVEFLDFFCEPCGYLPIPAPAGKLCSKEIQKEEIELSILNGKALDAIERAFDDGKVSKQEAKQIHQLLTRLMERAGEIKQKIAAEIR